MLIVHKRVEAIDWLVHKKVKIAFWLLLCYSMMNWVFKSTFREDLIFKLTFSSFAFIMLLIFYLLSIYLYL